MKNMGMLTSEQIDANGTHSVQKRIRKGLGLFILRQCLYTSGTKRIDSIPDFGKSLTASAGWLAI